MAPWSGRIISPSSRNEAAASPNAAASPARPRFQSRPSEADILDNAYGIPTLTTNAASPQRGHGRSMSHPFPSLFAGKKKRVGDNTAVTSGYEESTEEDDVMSPAQARQIAQNPTANKQLPKVPDKDLVTGKCMTCDSMVRWPKELKVFRCTVCLTINDLKPLLLEARRGDGHRAPVAGKTGSQAGSAYSQRVAVISLEKTRQVIDQCVTKYLLNRLRHDDGEESHSPPLSPRLAVPGSQRGPEDEHLTVQPPTELPIHLSGRPIEQSDGQADSRHGRSNLGVSPSMMYSTSSPGSLFGSRMEQRDRVTESGRGRGASMKTPSRDGVLFEKEKEDPKERKRDERTKSLFKSLEDYIIISFGSFECINKSFSTSRPNLAPRTTSESNRRNASSKTEERQTRADDNLSELDAKTLLIGDFAENGLWWTGSRTNVRSPERSKGHYTKDLPPDGVVTVKSPRIDWADMNEWYHLVLNAGRTWQSQMDSLLSSKSPTPNLHCPSDQEIEDIGHEMVEAQEHAQRVLLKVTESLLRRPGRPLKEPDDLRFLLIILANPLLYSSHSSSTRRPDPAVSRSKSRERLSPKKSADVLKSNIQSPPVGANRGSSGQHSGIIKRILGLLSNVSNESHHHLVSWFARYPDGQFKRVTDLIGSFVTYRLSRQHGKKREVKQDLTAGLVPSISGVGQPTPAALHAALGSTNQSSKKASPVGKGPVIYNDDWQIKAAARVMSLLFSANNSGLVRRGETRPLVNLETAHSAGLAARDRAHNHGQIIPTSDFYNTLLDYSDLIADFEAWEAKRGKFAFCQYPFFLSIWAKIQIMEHDARRQMEVKAREAFFDSIMTHKNVNQYLVLTVRRDCLVEDSLKGVSQVVGSGDEEIKKGLRIQFKGEEGIDAGGLRKEWFLLLVRDVFNPEHGMFSYDDESQFCYFNPNSFETTDQFFLVGVVLGLAIYNSTILDVALPPFAFRKLLAAGPSAAPGAMTHAKPSMTYTLEDLAEYRPSLATGLRKLLEFDGDVESTYCRDFVADIGSYGQTSQIALCPGGEKRPVTNANRREFVDLYVRYLLDTAVIRQFEPFKRGFFTVCGGNALSLFRPEEIELLIRGSDEPLDIASLRAVSSCDNWKVPRPAETEPVIGWFWQSWMAANPKDQRKLLSFITGSDRIPAMGATNLVIKLSCLGDDCARFPVARTCFNMISLYRYSSRQKLESMLWRAVTESEGFGLK